MQYHFALADGSDFFRDMPDQSEELCGDSDRTIHLDADPEVFAVLLWFIRPQDSFRDYAWTDLHPALDLAARYHFHTFPSLVPVYLDRYFSKDGSWETFMFASKYDFPGLAEQAIAKLGGCTRPTIDITTIKPFMFVNARAEYAVAFFQAIAKHSPSATIAASDFKIDWNAVSGSFDPRGK